MQVGIQYPRITPQRLLRLLHHTLSRHVPSPYQRHLLPETEIATHSTMLPVYDILSILKAVKIYYFMF
jgi:hypothetical protein